LDGWEVARVACDECGSGGLSDFDEGAVVIVR
jgi:hypothetical protein